MDIAADIVVETFPLRSVTSVTKPSYSLDTELGEASGMSVVLEEKEIEKVEKGSVLDGKNSPEDPFVLVDEKVVTSLAGSLLGMNSGLLDEEAVKNFIDPLLESSSTTSIDKDVVHCDREGTGLEAKTSHHDSLSSDAFEQSQEIVENKIRDLHMAKREEDIGYYAGYVGSAFMFGRALTSVAWGVVADRYGRKPVLIMGTITVAIFNTLFGLSVNF